ncbi:DnaB-like helicase C-terminal domain-containing protein [Pantoea sp. 18069]|uniref:replicative DNA helicase n=1 Tax=Pantoea sp. 18069 TaxID=2681415 RepID=UPI00190F607E|nr:DnaB-like helicase C-terminal domain-containing protein [Pantoea sp. 18069]
MNAPEFYGVDEVDLGEQITLQAEQSVLGGVVGLGAVAYDLIAGILKAGSFLDRQHQEIWSAAEAAILAGEDVDAIVVMKRLEGRVEPRYINQIALACGSMHGLKVHAEIVASAAAHRRLAVAARQALGDVDALDLTIEQRLARAVGRFELVLDERVDSDPLPVESFAVEFLDELQDMADGKVELGRETGIPRLNEVLAGGWYDGGLVVLAARPSVGKSSFAQQLALNQARSGWPSAFIGMEMTQKELMRRTVANLGRVPLRGLKTGKLSADEFSRVPEAMEYLRDLPFYLDYCPGATLVQLCAKARKVVRKHGVKFLVVDYLQLMQGSNERQDRRVQLQEITRGLKQLAGQLGITIVLLSQLNRDVEKRTNPRPTLADLKECGAIEEDADIVLALWDHRKGAIDEASIKGLAAIKGRDVGQGEMALHFDGKYQRWSESTESLSNPENALLRGKPKRYPDDY